MSTRRKILKVLELHQPMPETLTFRFNRPIHPLEARGLAHIIEKEANRDSEPK